MRSFIDIFPTHHIFQFFEFALEHSCSLMPGMIVTLSIWFSSMAVGFCIGTIMAVIRTYLPNSLPNSFVRIYMEIFRGTPLLMQIFFIYFGMAEIGVVFNPITAMVVSLSLNTAAYQAEYLRGSIISVDTGQMEAGLSLGMSKSQSIMHIVLPQAVFRSLPQISNEIIVELQFTALASTIGVPDIMSRANAIGSRTFRYFEAFLLAACIYFIVVNILIQLIYLMRRRAERGYEVDYL